MFLYYLRKAVPILVFLFIIFMLIVAFNLDPKGTPGGCFDC